MRKPRERVNGLTQISQQIKWQSEKLDPDGLLKKCSFHIVNLPLYVQSMGFGVSQT